MRVLVSVADADEARAAVAGGADVIDAKDPTRGALGAVGPAQLRGIVGAVAGLRPVSAALGEIGNGHAAGTVGDTTDDVRDPALLGADTVDGAGDAALLGALAADAAAAGVAFVKVGLAGACSVAFRVPAGAGCALVVAAYADLAVPPADRALAVAAACGAWGVLLDTRRKDGPGLLRLWSPQRLRAWIDAAHRAGLTAAVAGSLGAADLPVVRALGADLAGVRGAACDGGRSGRISESRVRALADSVRGRS